MTEICSKIKILVSPTISVGGGIVGASVIAVGIYLVIPKSQEHMEIGNECVGESGGYDECMKSIIPESEEAISERKKREDLDKLEKKGKGIMSNSDFYNKSRAECGNGNHSDNQWMQCYTDFTEKVRKTHYISTD